MSVFNALPCNWLQVKALHHVTRLPSGFPQKHTSGNRDAAFHEFLTWICQEHEFCYPHTITEQYD